MPELNRYTGEWPLMGAIQLKLKYTSQRYRDGKKKGLAKIILKAAKTADAPAPAISTRSRSRPVGASIVQFFPTLIVIASAITYGRKLYRPEDDA